MISLLFFVKDNNNKLLQTMISSAAVTPLAGKTPVIVQKSVVTQS